MRLLQSRPVKAAEIVRGQRIGELERAAGIRRVGENRQPVRGGIQVGGGVNPPRGVRPGVKRELKTIGDGNCQFRRVWQQNDDCETVGRAQQRVVVRHVDSNRVCTGR